ncbi:choice-of-anchor D domain-containing protein [Flammeovirga sp. SubArs3]|uniref:choice-of-anchor D domain-containing protein n=1 Tax=Flammeovirga sp. SubArs3 TaxID=2995316 RepID=UPI00248C281F|nr:choice-of-anchor D domain-containing protein [Flammeovirga sp. SubArs3]
MLRVNLTSLHLLSILILATSTSVLSQGKLALYTLNDKNEEIAFSNNSSINFGNPGVHPSLMARQLIIKNESDNEELIISKISISENSAFTFYQNEVLTIQPKNKTSIFCFYSPSDNIDRKESTVTFTTTDTQEPVVTFTTLVNDKEGELLITSSDYPVTNNTIDLGNMEIGESKNFTLNMTNNGEGYMYVEPPIVNNNTHRLDYSFQAKEVFAPGENYNNNIYFQAKKKGPIQATLKHVLQRGQKDAIDIMITGNVLAPVTEVYFEGNKLTTQNSIVKDPIPHQVQTYDFVIKNTGNTDLTINGVKIEGAAKKEYTLSNSGVFKTIPPNASLTYTLSLVPSSIGQKDVSLTFNTTDPDQPKIVVDFSTTVEEAILQFEDKEGNEIDYRLGYNLPSTQNGTVIQGELFIRNIGNVALSISDVIEINDSFEEMSFILSGSTIAPNGREKLDFTFKPHHRNYPVTSFPIDLISNNFEDKDIRLVVNGIHKFTESTLTYNGNTVTEDYPIDFGRVDINHGKEVVILVENEGNLPVTINNVNFKNPLQTDFAIKSFTQTEITSGGKGEIKVICNTSKFNELIDVVLSVETNDYLYPIQTVKLTANPVKSDLYISNPSGTMAVWDGDTEKFGSLTIDQDREYTYVLKNRGGAPLNIQSLVMANTDKFDLNFETPQFPIQLAPQEEVEVKMKATSPKVPGTFSTKVEINTDEPNRNRFTFYVEFTNKVPVIEVSSLDVITTNTTIDFDKIESYQLTLKNIGNEILELDNVNINNKAFTTEYNQEITFLRPEETLDITIHYNEKQNTNNVGVFSIASNDINIPNFTLYLAERKSTVTNIHQEKNTIKVFPNPATDLLTIQGLEKTSQIHIVNLQGILMMECWSDRTVNISHLPSGVYILQIEKGSTIKFIKK